MARALTSEERLRYPWATRIVDYLPIGRWRKVALRTGLGGLALYLGGTLAIYVFSPYLKVKNGLPDGVAEYLVMVPAFAAMAFGFSLGLVTAIQAAVKQARPALAWSVGAMLPGIVMTAVLLALR